MSIAAARLRQKLADTERGLRDLAKHREGLAHELEQGSSAESGADFDRFISTGAITINCRSTAQIEAELADCDAMTAAGEAQIAALGRQIEDADRAARAEWLSNLTMNDAIRFAEETLAEVDLAAVKAELDRIEALINEQDRPRLDAARLATQADLHAQRLSLSRDQRPEAIAALTKAKDERARAFAMVEHMRNSVRASQRLHEEVRQDLVGKVTQAMSHVARLASVEAAKLEKYASGAAAVAKALATPSGPRFGDYPADIDVALPTAAQMAALQKAAEPILALSRRASPPARPESAYVIGREARAYATDLSRAA